MNTLISKELLGLVLDMDIRYIYPDNTKITWEHDVNIHNTVCYEKQNDTVYDINLDTLTRLMKEWCYSQEYVIKTVHYGNKVTVGLAGTNNFKSHYNDEFAGVAEYTNFVAKQKGLLC